MIEDIAIKEKPTIRKDNVLAELPADIAVNIMLLGGIIAHLQLSTLSLNPTNTSVTPATIRNKPMKSKSATFSLNVRPLWGLRLREKNNIALAMPPVGLGHG